MICQRWNWNQFSYNITPLFLCKHIIPMSTLEYKTKNDQNYCCCSWGSPSSEIVIANEYNSWRWLINELTQKLLRNWQLSYNTSLLYFVICTVVMLFEIQNTYGCWCCFNTTWELWISLHTYLSQVQRMLFWFPRQFVMEQLLYRVAGSMTRRVYSGYIYAQYILYPCYLWCYNGIAGAWRCLSTCIRSASRPSKRFPFLFPFVFASNVFELTSHHVNQRRLFLVPLVVNCALVEIPTSWLLPGRQ